MDLAINTLVWDNHHCMPLRTDTEFLPQLYQVKRSGVDIVTLNIAFGSQTMQQARAVRDTYVGWIKEHADDICLVETPADIRKAKADGRLGICFHVEGGDPLGQDLAHVEQLYTLGVRWMLAAYNKNNGLGGGCLDEDGGLTHFGRDVVAEMNRVGMVVCGSHCGPRTAMDLIEASSSPAIFSHSNAARLCQHPRNIADEMMRACADKGGVIGICGFAQFLGEDGPLAAMFAARIDHALKVAGEDHVGLALDYVFDSKELDDFLSANPDMFPPDVFAAGGAAMTVVSCWSE